MCKTSYKSYDIPTISFSEKFSETYETPVKSTNNKQPETHASRYSFIHITKNKK